MGETIQTDLSKKFRLAVIVEGELEGILSFNSAFERSCYASGFGSGSGSYAGDGAETWTLPGELDDREEEAKRRLSEPANSGLYRWAQKGIRGNRLQTVMVGGCRFTCDAWVWSFIEASTVPAGTTSTVAARMPGVEGDRIRRRFGLNVAVSPARER